MPNWKNCTYGGDHALEAYEPPPKYAQQPPWPKFEKEAKVTEIKVIVVVVSKN